MAEILYAIRQSDQKVVSISDISCDISGLKCDCICPICKRPLQACSLNGKVQPYFRHHTDSKDGGGGGNFYCNVLAANETALHLMAKQIIAEEKKIFIPEKKIDYSETGENKLPARVTNNIKPYLHQKSTVVAGEVELEKAFDDAEIRVDAVIKKEQRELLIEIYVCHKVDEAKKEKIKSKNLMVLEVDLSGFLEEVVSYDKLRTIITETDKNKHWINYYVSDKTLEKVKDYYNNHNVTKNYYKHLEEAAAERAKEEEKRQKKEERRSKSQEKLNYLFEPKNYAAELDRLRDDIEFQKKYREIHKYGWYDFDKHLQKNKSLPFFVDIPITGEMVFQCDRRIWQSIVFNRYIYHRKNDKASINMESVFECLTEDYAISYDYDLCYKLQNPLSEGKNIWLPGRVIECYFKHLEYLGFISTLNKQKKNWKTVEARKTIEPPNKKEAEYLERCLKEVDVKSPNIDRLISEQIQKYIEEDKRKIRETEQKERKRIMAKNGCIDTDILILGNWGFKAYDQYKKCEQEQKNLKED